MLATERPCGDLSCSTPVGPKGAKGLCPRHYAASRGRCSQVGCSGLVNARGMCSKHYSRWRTSGDPNTTVSGRVVFKAEEVCSVQGCDGKRRKREWCASHYAQWQRTGRVRPFAYKWARATDCFVCGKPVQKNGKTCSPNCAAIDVRHSGARPQTKPCERCSNTIDLTVTSRRGSHLRRSDTRMCDDCYRAKTTRHKMSVSTLFERDGGACGICGEMIDMSLRHPDRMRASVDHVVPFSRGGTHAADNLQLSHLRCNSLKSDRLDFRWASSPRTRYREEGGQTPWQ